MTSELRMYKITICLGSYMSNVENENSLDLSHN